MYMYVKCVCPLPHQQEMAELEEFELLERAAINNSSFSQCLAAAGEVCGEGERRRRREMLGPSFSSSPDEGTLSESHCTSHDRGHGYPEDQDRDHSCPEEKEKEESPKLHPAAVRRVCPLDLDKTLTPDQNLGARFLTSPGTAERTTLPEASPARDVDKTPTLGWGPGQEWGAARVHTKPGPTEDGGVEQSLATGVMFSDDEAWESFSHQVSSGSPLPPPPPPSALAARLFPALRLERERVLRQREQQSLPQLALSEATPTDTLTILSDATPTAPTEPPPPVDSELGSKLQQLEAEMERFQSMNAKLEQQTKEKEQVESQCSVWCGVVQYGTVC